jgi:DNA mismatch repair ATPase MutS
MKIDLQSISELELQKDNSKKNSVFELIDFTETPGGKYKLKTLFRKTLPDVETIKKHQEAVKFVMQDIKLWKLPLNTELADRLDVYYFSDSGTSLANNFITRFVESISYRFIYKDFSKTFIAGTKNLIYFLKKTDKFRKDISGNAFPVLLSNYFSRINEILDLPEIEEAINISAVNKLSKTVLLYFDKIFREKHKVEILELIDIIYELDVLISKAKANIKLGLNFPEFTEGKEPVFKAENLYHLFVKEPVKNSVDFSENKNFIFLTGPNMAGKTTFLKACGVAVFMAHIGMGVPAKSLKLSYFDRLFTSLNISDNLSKGYSYFYSEVRRVKEVAEILEQSQGAFIIFDELFKGTNIKDAFEGSLRIIRALSKRENSLFMLSSHLLELGEELANEATIKFLYFDSLVENGKPYFNYLLKEGLSDERLGMLILENEGVFKLLEKNDEN